MAETLTTTLRTNSWQSPGKYKWIWGPTGCGKTKSVFEKYKPEEIYLKDSSKWFDGFDPTRHKCILIDDYRKQHDGLGLDDLLRIAQPYECRVQIKGGYVQLGMQDIVVTSNTSPRGTFGDGVDISPLERRFHIINMIKKEIPDSPPGCIDLTIEEQNNMSLGDTQLLGEEQ